MREDMGVPPAGSGHSAEPEPISVVSAAMAASVPNAVLIFLDLIERNTSTLDHALIEANALAERRGGDRLVVEPWMPFLLALRQRLLHERLVEAETEISSGVRCERCRKQLVSVRHARFVGGDAFNGQWLCEKCK